MKSETKDHHEGWERLSPPRLEREPGWLDLDMPEVHGIGRPFLSPDDRVRIQYFRREEDGALVGKVWFGPGSEGPPGNAHGGSIASVLDEAMGGATWLQGHVGLLGRMTTEYRKPVPLGTVASLVGEISRVDGRKVFTRGLLVDTEGIVLAEAEGLYVEISIDRLLEHLSKSEVKRWKSAWTGSE